ncbi:AAA family ATPase [Planctomycetota bacterium]|nr:AAA family ATPase [Planctomycetota bacterium]
MSISFENISRIRDEITQGLATKIIGQEKVIEEVMISLLSGGHILVMGVPGLAKTLLVRSISELLQLEFSRIQFTPDLMPQDITGASILDRESSTGGRQFSFAKGPLFANMVLGDEINRTPPKTQAALLEGMEEGQVTVMGVRHPLPDPFFVMATQNPLEQEGTYPLPVTQLDRFSFQILMDYPNAEEELDVVSVTTAMNPGPLKPVVTAEWLREASLEVRQVQIPDFQLIRATRIVRSTRPQEEGAPEAARELLYHGAGPRGVQTILATARARAALNQRNTVTDEDIDAVLFPSLRHRLGLSVHAEAEGLEPDQVLIRILEESGDRPEETDSETLKQAGFFKEWLSKLADTTPYFRS